MKTRLLLVAAGSSLAALFFHAHTLIAATQANYYVSPSGNDSTGNGSLATPWATIGKARDFIRTNSLNTNMTGDIVVNVRGGTYKLTSTIAFTDADSGSNGFNVIYRAYGIEKPILSGGTQITGWTATGNGMYQASIGTLRFRQLYVNGVPGVRARTPNTGFYNTIPSFDTTNQAITIPASEISNWARLNQVEMVIPNHWTQENLRISSFSVNGSNASVVPMSPERAQFFAQAYPGKTSPAWGPNWPFYFENAYEFLDTAGEWYINTDTNILYYMPRPNEAMTSATVIAPQVQTLMTVQGASLSAQVHNVAFVGLTFSDSTWTYPTSNGYVGGQNTYQGGSIPAAINVQNANNLRFERNVFRDLGASALMLYTACQNNTIVGNTLRDIAANGIQLDGTMTANPSDSRSVCKSNVVIDNYITRVGAIYGNACGIFAVYTDSCRIDHNEIAETAYTGISCGWGWTLNASAEKNNLIRYNNIYGTNTINDDGGAIYLLSNSPGTIVDSNYCHDLERNPFSLWFPEAGIYLDQGSDNITVENNVLANIPTFNGNPDQINLNETGTNNTLTNNSGTSQATIDNSGLEVPYRDIKGGANVALRQVTSASSTSGAFVPGAAVDGIIADPGWSATGSDPNPWWEIDLGGPARISRLEVVSRLGVDQITTRRNFVVWGSNNADMSLGHTVLGTLGSGGFPYLSTFGFDIGSSTAYRYVALNKTVGEYFYLNEVRIITADPYSTVFEAEGLAMANSSGDTYRTFSDATLTDGWGSILDATAVGDYVTLVVPGVAAGTYDVRVGVKLHPTRGIWQLAIGPAGSPTPANLGSPQDEYSATPAPEEIDLGNWTPTSTSDKWFRFTVTGKNASSTGYTMAFDYIKLIPQ